MCDINGYILLFVTGVFPAKPRSEAINWVPKVSSSLSIHLTPCVLICVDLCNFGFLCV